jgi:polysaccharide chain length determinant protein (PEP-CTERM system associated)
MLPELRALIESYLAGFWARRWSIVAVAWLACLAGWGFVVSLPDRYESTSRIYVDTETILGPLLKGLAVTPDIEAQVGIIRRTLLSRPNLEQLIRLADLDLTVTTPAQRERLIEALGNDIKVQLEGSNNLFRVSYQSTDPQRAYRVVDAILQIFVEQNLGRTQQNVAEAQNFINRQIADYEKKLRDAELEVAAFKRAHAEELAGARLNQERADQAQANLQQLRGELESLIWRRDQLRQQLATTPAALTEAELDPVRPSPTQERLAALRAQLDEQLLIYTERHPSVTALRQRIAQLEQQAAAEGGPGGPRGREVPNPVYKQIEATLDGMALSIEDTRRRITLAEEAVQRATATAAQTPQVEADLRRLTRDYEVLSEQYAQLVQRRESAQLASRLDSDTRTVEFRIIDPPLVPIQPIGPPRGLFMLATLVVGIGAGFGVAVLRIFLKDAVVSAHQLQETFGLPVLGTVSVVRSALHSRVKIAEGMALSGTVLTLFVTAGLAFYVYQFSPTTPDLDSLAAGLRERVGAVLPSL